MSKPDSPCHTLIPINASGAATRAARAFDAYAVPFSYDPDEYVATFNGMLLESVETAVRGAGFDLDADGIWDEIWDVTMAMEPDEVGFATAGHEFRLAAPRPPGVARSAARIAPMRRGRRTSRGRSTRVRGSRPCSSRSAGGGSSGDPDEGEPARGRHQLQIHLVSSRVRP